MLPAPGWAVHNIEIADFNKDNWLDICFVMQDGGYNYIYWGSISGFSPDNHTLLAYPSGNGHGLSVADLDNNGCLDLIFTGTGMDMVR